MKKALALFIFFYFLFPVIGLCARPKAYAGRKFVVLGVEVLSNKKTGQPMNIIYLQGEKPKLIIWVDFDKAFETGELKLLD